ncbi:hypothetical protein JW826_05020 [Candidatus Woesearchaeota archaeon]|nr:hypothetical protein [Candidatus Woesearchaeota archaeon]
MSTKNYIPAEDVTAVTLVGGEGSRLGPLVWSRTKAGVQFGTSRVTAAAISSAFNSGVERAVLATQYLPFSLRKFYSTIYGVECGPDRKITIISPHDTMKEDATYRGTAHAFSEALKIAGRMNPKYVLGLSGDHTYKFNFAGLFDQFYDRYDDNSFIVLTKKVKREEAHRFGIIQIKKGNTKIVSFKEKPQDHELPEGDELDASLGIYFAPTRVWQKALEIDQERARREESEQDLGKNVIPFLINRQNEFKVHAFPFSGYWQDVGEPQAYYETCKDVFLKRNPDLFGDPTWKIDGIGEPEFIGNGKPYFKGGDVKINESNVGGTVISPGTTIERSTVEDSILLGQSHNRRTNVRNYTTIRRAIVDKASDIGPNAEITSEEGVLIVTKDTRIPSGVKIRPKGDAVVASLERMAENYTNLTKYIDNLEKKGIAVQLYDPEGNEHHLEEIVTLGKALKR